MSRSDEGFCSNRLSHPLCFVSKHVFQFFHMCKTTKKDSKFRNMFYGMKVTKQAVSFFERQSLVVTPDAAVGRGSIRMRRVHSGGGVWGQLDLARSETLRAT